VNGFVSYSHDDCGLFCEFRPHLRALERVFGMRFWSDHRISAGYRWDATVRREISCAQVFVLLVSPAFIGSDYIFDQEIAAIRDRKKSDEVLVLPVILERCSWQWLCGALQAVPIDPDGRRIKPIADWRPRKNGFDRAREQIEEALRNHYGLDPPAVDWPAPR
jgi:hypothetical protein